MAAVAPTASVSVTMTIREKVGARRKLRKEWRTSRRNASHMREFQYSGRTQRSIAEVFSRPTLSGSTCSRKEGDTENSLAALDDFRSWLIREGRASGAAEKSRDLEFGIPAADDYGRPWCRRR